MKRIAIIGANGQLGSALENQFRATPFNIALARRPEVDLADVASIKGFIAGCEPSIVINAAAYTAVDNAESDPENAYAVNASGPAHLAEICRSLRIPLVHYSTDYVFDGSKSGAYDETDPVSPVGVYGKSKSAGEEKIRAILPRHIIIRTSWLYGLHGNNFVKTMLKLGQTHETLRVVSDQQGCPTFAGDLAAAALQIVGSVFSGENEIWGTYHYANTGATSWHGFAAEIFRLAAQIPSYKMACQAIDPIPTAEYPTPARRPPNSVLDCSKIRKTFGIEIPHWKESLAGVMPEMVSRF